MPSKLSAQRKAINTEKGNEQSGFNLHISTETQIAITKGLILTLIVVVMGFLAYHKINEPVVWSSIMTIAGYVAFANPKTSADGEHKK